MIWTETTTRTASARCSSDRRDRLNGAALRTRLDRSAMSGAMPTRWLARAAPAAAAANGGTPGNGRGGRLERRVDAGVLAVKSRRSPPATGRTS